MAKPLGFTKFKGEFTIRPTNTTFENMPVTGGSGQNMVVDLQVAGGGGVKAVTLDPCSSNFPGSATNAGKTILEKGLWRQTVNTGTGTGLQIEAVATNTGATCDDNKLLELKIIKAGDGYSKGDRVTLTCLENAVTMTVTVDQVSPAAVTLVSNDDGQNYFAGDELTITRSDLLGAGATEISGQVQWVYNLSGEGVSYDNEGLIDTVRLEHPEASIVAVPEGVYEVDVQGGSGYGAKVALTSRGGGEIMEYEISSTPFASTTEPPKKPVAFDTTGGSGVGARLTLGVNRGYPVNDSDGIHYEYTGGNFFFDTDGSSTGVAYQTGDVITVSAATLTDYNGNELDVAPGSPDATVTVTRTSPAKNSVEVIEAGQGYLLGDEIYIEVEGKTFNLIIDKLVDGGYETPTATNSDGGFTHTTLGEDSSDFNFVGGSGTSSSSSSFSAAVPDVQGKLGLVSVRVTKSVSDNSQALSPDSVASPVTATIAREANIDIRSNAYVGPAKEFVEQESFPVPILTTDQEEAESIVNQYANALKRFYRGDYYGLSIAEAVTPEICEGWKINSPFRYADSHDNRIMAMRMDGTAWSVTSDGAVFATNALWVGNSNGTLNMPQNLNGNDGPTTVTVTDETFMDEGGYIATINIDFHSEMQALVEVRTPEQDVFVNHVLDLDLRTTTVVYARGAVVTAGDTITVAPNGSVPLSTNGTAITVGATYVVDDIFAA